jgi:hypothetical protein
MPQADRRIYDKARTVSGSHPLIGKIVGFSSQKQFGAAAGQFSLTIKAPEKLGRTSWLRLWPDPEDTWVRVTFVVDGQPMETVFGLVDTISESMGRAGMGQRTATYTIHCRDFGKVFEETKLFVNFVQGESRVRNTLAIHTGLPQYALQGPPSHFIRALLDLWVGNNGMAEKQWELPRSLGSSTFYDLLNKGTIQEMGKGNGESIDPNMLSPDQQGGSLWDAMQQYSNGLMNELWLDLGPDPANPTNLGKLKPAIYLRERMFPTRESRRRWDSLRTRTLELGDVQSRQLSKGGAANRYNYWKISGGFLNDDYSMEFLTKLTGPQPYRPGAIPIINEESIRLHGVRKWEQRTDFLPIAASRGVGSDGQPNIKNRNAFITLAANWLKRIHDWYAVAPLQMTGQIKTTRVMPEIRVGERLRERRRDGSVFYYVEGINHDWMYPGPGVSTITVTRGEFKGDNLLDAIYAQYDAPRIVREEDCLITGKDFTREQEGDDLIRALARGCRFAVVEERGVESLETFESIEEAQAALEGLVAEGAPTPESLGQTPDPEMVPNLADTEAAHATLIAEGLTQDTVPPTVVEEPEIDLVFTLEDLESGRQIPIAEDDPGAAIDLESDDPLAGIEEDIGL